MKNLKILVIISIVIITMLSCSNVTTIYFTVPKTNNSILHNNSRIILLPEKHEQIIDYLGFMDQMKETLSNYKDNIVLTLKDLPSKYDSEKFINSKIKEKQYILKNEFKIDYVITITQLDDTYKTETGQETKNFYSAELNSNKEMVVNYTKYFFNVNVAIEIYDIDQKKKIWNNKYRSDIIKIKYDTDSEEISEESVTKEGYSKCIDNFIQDVTPELVLQKRHLLNI